MSQLVHAQLKKLSNNMDRVLLTKESLINSGVLETQFFLVDENVSSIEVPENSKTNILFLTLPKEKDFIININKNAESTIAFLAKTNVDGYKITINIKENSKVEGYFADFTSNQESFVFTANLLERNAVMNWHLASLTAGSDNKKFDISVNHNSPSTFARMDNYGVCKDDGILVFSGISTIFNGSKGSKTHQNSKIMVFDKLSNGIAKPILKIDENDIEASHAAVVGKINDEHLFYLTSRGLTESAAKELITFGYLKPIMNGFVDEEIKQEISTLIEERM